MTLTIGTPMIMPMADGSFVIDARANLEDVSKVINIEFLTNKRK